jgi:type II secretory pathway pseudopilin PulG
MRFTRTNLHSRAAERRRAGFTLAEVLAALLFMAIVIPVAVEAVRVAGQAGQVAARKAVAARLADRVLNELVATGQWQHTTQGGTLSEGSHEYQWLLDNEPWEFGALRLLTVRVAYTVQGREYTVLLSTLVDPAATATTTTTMSGSTGQGGVP